MGGGAQFQLEGTGEQYAAELRTLLVSISERLGRLGQNWGHWGAHFSLGAAAPGPRRTAPGDSGTLVYIHSRMSWQQEQSLYDHILGTTTAVGDV